MAPSKNKSIPFEFVLDYLLPADPVIRPMFGCHSVYVGERIVLILRKREDHMEDNGVWIATTPQHHASLKKEFPSMRSIKIFGPGITGWQVLPVEDDDFEKAVTGVCELILKNDVRIGKIPKPRKRKSVIT